MFYIDLAVFVCLWASACACKCICSVRLWCSKRTWMLNACFCICASVLLTKSYRLLLCVSLHTFSDPHELSEVRLRDPDRGWGGRCCEDPVQHLCQTLHLPGSPGWGHATGPHWQLPQQPAGTSVGVLRFIALCAYRNEAFLTTSNCNKPRGCRGCEMFRMHQQQRCYPVLFSQTAQLFFSFELVPSWIQLQSNRIKSPYFPLLSLKIVSRQGRMISTSINSEATALVRTVWHVPATAVACCFYNF